MPSGVLRAPALALPALPLASSALMLLLSCLWWAGAGHSLALNLDLTLGHWQVYRLLSFPLGHTALPGLLLSLALCPTLGWQEESRLGTLGYAWASVLSSAGSGLLYALLAGLGAPGAGSACGYTPVHLALLASRPRGPGQLAKVAPACLLLLGLGRLLGQEEDSPLLLHLCALLWGLLSSSGKLRCLELSERRLRQWQDSAMCRALKGHWLVRFIPAPGQAGVLPIAHPARTRSPTPVIPPNPPRILGSGPPRPPALAGGPSWPGAPALFWPPPAPGNPQSLPTPWLLAEALDERLLQAGIEASLLEPGPPGPGEELRLPKSSVSSLRLQQLERMGFPTERAVVALAATGRVEGAVSLLVGGQVGDEALVTTEARAQRLGEGGGLVPRGLGPPPPGP
ncbi:rhomboid domain-containing protein 3 [Tachyglossus aculeatus]|uniref:rhomboid domain-containing protein 3 n=1 Tax=Tachyglossus aculeatus TaxID=9261 RepID=UPI0018F38C7B|nr:rhomboid domain-containing protein 3 [Tachyglossus aculeatus]